QLMVQYFNQHVEAPSKLDILQAIYLIADSWESVTQSTIIHCWKKAGIMEQIQVSNVNESENMDPVGQPRIAITEPVEQFISFEERECRQAFDDLRNTRLSDFQNIDDCFNSYFPGLSSGPSSDDEKDEGVESPPTLPDIVAIIQEEV